jgi:hypothetical protein
MKYRVFETEGEVIAAEAAIASAIGCIKIGANALTGQPEPTKQATVRWAIPQQIADGRWAIPSPDDEGEESSPDWWAAE